MFGLQKVCVCLIKSLCLSKLMLCQVTSMFGGYLEYSYRNVLKFLDTQRKEET